MSRWYIIHAYSGFENKVRDAIMAEARTNPNLVNLDTDLKLNKPELKVTVDRDKTADVGVPVEIIGRTLETMLGQAVGDLPDWHELGSAVTLEPWAQSLAQAVLAQPGGARFMAVAAGLEYLHQHAHLSAAAHAAAGEGADANADHGDDGETAEHDDDFNVLSADDAVEPRSDRDREEAGASWLADAGFERKD